MADDGGEAERPNTAEADRIAGFVNGSLLEAAHEMLSAPDLTGIADATLRHAVRIVGAKDAFLAMVEDVAPRSSGRSGTARPPMRLIAGSGEFETRKLRIRRGTGFWGRVWQEASTLRDGTGSDTGLVGVPLSYDGQVMGLLGLVAPDADGVTNEQLHQLSRLAALASAAAASAGRRSEGATSGAVSKARTG